MTLEDEVNQPKVVLMIDAAQSSRPGKRIEAWQRRSCWAAVIYSPICRTARSSASVQI